MAKVSHSGGTHHNWPGRATKFQLKSLLLTYDRNKLTTDTRSFPGMLLGSPGEAPVYRSV